PREQRIADAVTWHKTLSKLMIDSNFSPTTFNLAFFMHSLFRDEIERENQEVQAEKKLELTPRPAAPVPVPVAAPAAAAQDMREATGVRGVREATLPGTRVHGSQQAAEPSKKPLWIGIAAAAVIALAAGGYFLFGRGEAPAVTPAIPPAAQVASMPGGLQPSASPAVGTTAGPTPEELQAQIQGMFEARSKEMEDKLKGQYDDRIKQLQQQLQESKKAEPAKLDRIAEKAEPPAPAPAETRAVPKPEAAAPPQVTPPQPAAQTPAVEKPAPSPAPANPAPSQPAVPRPQAQVQLGDLVQPGAGVAAPKLSSNLDPRYPPAAKHLNRSAQVDIKVLVDERGQVLDADRIGAKAGFGFDEAALDAARKARFQAATKDGIRVKMWTTLRVNFKPM
ncbi:MAG: TonB family protein, partial [Thermoanaerobaculia bacterium]